jgi:hypothetical protein
VIASVLPLQRGQPVAAASQALASVRYIKKGLTVQPPHQTAAKGKVKQSLYSAYRLQTKQAQIASIAFQDGSLLHMNQKTDATLRSASVTQIKQGEVVQEVVPGTNHQIQTSSAVASAVGTLFDVKVNGTLTIITVIEGAVLVSSPHGTVLVTSGQQVRIRKGQAPGSPVSVDAASTIAWTTAIPPPSAPLGLNVALAANGGTVYAWSSQRNDPGHAFDAQNANDGRLDRGWQSASGQTAGQWLRISFQGAESYPIAAVFLDCAATGGQDPGNALKDFSIETSDSSTGPFQTALAGVCQDQNGLQVFPLSTPVSASYVQLSAKDNNGGTGGIALAEIGVISVKHPAVLGTATATPTAPATPTPTVTPTSGPTSTPTATAPAGLTSVVLTPANIPSCSQVQTVPQFCGVTGADYSYLCDLRMAQQKLFACAGTFTGIHCVPPPNTLVTALPYDCSTVLAPASSGVTTLYIFIVEASPSYQAWSPDASHFTLEGGGGSMTAVGAVPPGKSGPYTQPFMPTTLAGAADSNVDIGWVKFAIGGAGAYTLHWSGPGGDVTLGTLTVS